MNPTVQLVEFIAGIVWPYLFKALGSFNLTDRSAQWAVAVFSVIISAVVIVASGQSISAGDLVAGGGILFSTSQLVYRQLIKTSTAPPHQG